MNRLCANADPRSAHLRRWIHGVSVIAMAASLAAPTTLWAQASSEAEADEDASMEEMLITARRREEGLQEVPITVSALDDEFLEQFDLRRATELQDYIPNLTINTGFGTSNPQIFIRGVGSGNFNDNAQATVGVYLDDVFLSAQAGKLLQMFDLESVQALKGPQGTLFGRNNTGGALLFTPRKPDGTFNGYVRGTAGRFGQADIEAAVGFPIAEGLSMRISAQRNSRNGYGDLINFENGDVIDDLGEIDETAARAILRYEREKFSVEINASIADADNDRLVGRNLPVPGPGDALGFIPRDPDDVFQNSANYPNTDEARTAGMFLTANYEFPIATFTSISAYWAADRSIRLDVDHSPNNLLHLTRNVDSEQFSQEFRLASNTNGRFDWIVGLFYLTENMDIDNRFAFFSGPDPTIVQDYNNDTDTGAAFAELIWRATDRLSFTVGGRITYDNRDFDIVLDPAFGGDVEAFEESWTEPSWRFIADYQLTDDVLIFISANHSFQGGGFNGGAFSIVEVGDGFDPEFITAFEGGAKTTWFDGRLTANAAGFYYDYDDIQVFTLDSGLAADNIANVVQTITNAEGARIFGLDLDLTAQVTDHFEVGFGLGLLDSEYQDLVLLGEGGTLASGDGNQLINAPTVDLVVNAQYARECDWGAFMIAGNYSYRSRRYLDITERELTSGDPYGLLNGRLSFFVLDDQLEFGAWAKNVLDEEYLTYQGDVTTGFGFIEELYGLPRTYGVDVTYRWG